MEYFGLAGTVEWVISYLWIDFGLNPISSSLLLGLRFGNLPDFFAFIKAWLASIFCLYLLLCWNKFILALSRHSSIFRMVLRKKFFLFLPTMALLPTGNLPIESTIINTPYCSSSGLSPSFDCFLVD